jgi:hypothetical protein
MPLSARPHSADFRLWLALGLVLTGGVVLRSLHYAANRSLSMDESFIALNVIRRDTGQLLETLDWNSGAPLAFLQIENAVTAIFGYSELAFRAYPFVASLLALVLFGVLALRLLRPWIAVLAIAYFAMLPPVISYAAVTKQYSADVLVGVAIMLLVVLVRSDEYGNRSMLALALVGLLAPAFSHPSVFYLVGACGSLAVGAWKHYGRRAVGRVAVLGAVWGTAVIAVWLWQRGALERLAASWESGYLDSFGKIRTAFGESRAMFGVQSSPQTFLDPGDVATVVLVALVVVGVISILRSRLEDALLLLTPLAGTAVAPALGYYPLSTRTLLFTAPLLALLAAKGADGLLGLVRGRAAVIVAVAPFCLVFAFAATHSIRDLPSPFADDDGVRSAMAQLAAEQRPGDTLFLHYAAQYPFAYYLTCDCAPRRVRRAWRSGLWRTEPVDATPAQFSPALSNTDDFQIGRFRGYDVATVETDLASLDGRSPVWVLRTFLRPEDDVAFDKLLDRRGRRLATLVDGQRIDSARLSRHDFSQAR